MRGCAPACGRRLACFVRRTGVPMIRAVLLDADGVVQSSPKFLAMVAEFVPEERRPEFIQAIFDAERPCLTGDADFRDTLATVLADWKLESFHEAFMRVFHDIQIDQGVLRQVETIRKLGVMCCLASNQQSYRAKHMSVVLGYKRLFDREFYSHLIRVAKPDTQYFRSILGSLALPASQVLFIDDSMPNVLAASNAGLQSEHFPSNSGSQHLGALLRQHGLQVA